MTKARDLLSVQTGIGLQLAVEKLSCFSSQVAEAATLGFEVQPLRGKANPTVALDALTAELDAATGELEMLCGVTAVIINSRSASEVLTSTRPATLLKLSQQSISIKVTMARKNLLD